MDQADLRAKIRELMASGDLPSAPPLMERLSPGQAGAGASRIVVTNPRPEQCSICGEPGPQVSYFYPAGQVVRVHAACDAVWQQYGQAWATVKTLYQLDTTAPERVALQEMLATC